MKHSLLLSVSFLFIMMGCNKEENNTPTYSKVGITKVTLLGFPATKSNGSNWDAIGSYSNPDPRVKIGNFTSGYFDDISNTNLPIYWQNQTSSPLIIINDVNSQVDVILEDVDGLNISQETMATVTFNLSNYSTGSNKYPSSATVNSFGTTIKLDFAWSN